MDDGVTLKDRRDGGHALAAKLCIEGNHDKVRLVLIELLKLIPNDSDVMTMMAEILIAESKLTQAKVWLDKAIIPYPNFPIALYKMSVIYQTQLPSIHKRRGKNC